MKGRFFSQILSKEGCFTIVEIHPVGAFKAGHSTIVFPGHLQGPVGGRAE